MFAFTSGVSDPESWFTLGNIVQFRVSRIWLHAVYFILGICTFKWRWIQRGIIPGHQKTWVVAFILSFLSYIISLFLMKTAPDGLEQLYGLVFWFCLNFFTISALGLSISLALNYWNKPSLTNRNLAANSYNLYLAHYIFVLGFQLLFLQLPQIPVIVKFLLVSTLSLSGGYLVCQFVIKPFPKLTILAIASIFVAMVVVIHP